MIDWPETRLQIQLWLHQSWPFRVLAWVRTRGVPDTQGFGKFREGSKPPAGDGSRLHAEVAERESPGEADNEDQRMRQELLETAADLGTAGVMDAEDMARIQALCKPRRGAL